jgi:hypothetical protein
MAIARSTSPAPKHAAERKLDFHRIAVDLGHAREDFRGAVEAIVDQVVEPDVVVARQAHGARNPAAVPEAPGDAADDNERECQKQWRQLNHCSPLRRSVTDRPIGSIVDALAQILAWLEVRHVLARERDGLAGFGIPSLPRRAKMQGEAAESPDFDALALREGVAHDLEHLLQRKLDILGGQMLLLRGDDLDEFRFRHGSPDLPRGV